MRWNLCVDMFFSRDVPFGDMYTLTIIEACGGGSLLVACYSFDFCKEM